MKRKAEKLSEKSGISYVDNAAFIRKKVNFSLLNSSLLYSREFQTLNTSQPDSIAAVVVEAILKDFEQRLEISFAEKESQISLTKF